MIKRTLYFGNPCTIRKKDLQLTVTFPEEEDRKDATIPIEDIGLVILDNPQIMVSNALLVALSENNTAILNCDASHLPFGLMLPMYSHYTFSERLATQIELSGPLKKNLWQQTVIWKIENQSAHLRSRGVNTAKMEFLVNQVKSGDPSNVEGRAAAYYWDQLFNNMEFTRDRYGESPNNLLNYGYAVLRAIVARSLVGSGLFPAIGIHHQNKYNPYCLADDIMEPYRPYVDRLAMRIFEADDSIEELTPALKKELLQIPVLDVEIDGKNSPLMVGMQRTTASLAACFDGSQRKILYPKFTCD